MANMKSPASGLGSGRTLTIMPTYACPAACANCGTLSHPRARSKLEREVVITAIREASDLGFANVVFTGGEATLEWDLLKEGITFATSRGLPTRLVTNAHWASTRDAARERLAELAESGLSEINFSTGDEHVRFVPLQSVVNATVESLPQGFRPFVVVELRRERQVTRLLVHQRLRENGMSEEDLDHVRIEESPWMPLDPAARADYPDGVAVNRDNLAQQVGCDNVLQTFVVQADGRIGACCGLGMRLVPELNVGAAEGEHFLQLAMERADNDFLKLWIRHDGPERVLAWAAAHDESIDWENRYGHKCQACLRVYKDPKVASVIRNHYQEVIPRVLQTAWLAEQVIPELLSASREK